MLTDTAPPSSEFLARGPRPLDRLINGIREIVRRETDSGRVGRAVADLLQPYLATDDLLDAEQLQPDPAEYRQHILHIEPDGSFSIAALVWLPGQATVIHDHVSWCVVGVYQGAEYETRYELAGGGTDPHLIEAGKIRNQSGSVEAFVPPGDIHQVANNGETLAVSLHIYGADLGALGCSVRRRYDLPVR